MTPGDGHLAGGEHVDEHHGVGIGERVDEVIAERLEARVAMRLEHNGDLGEIEGFGGMERRLDLGGMVAVVIHEHDAARLAHVREAAARTLEGGQGASRVLGVKTEHIGGGKGGRGVEHVVAAGIVLDGDRAHRAVGQG